MRLCDVEGCERQHRAKGLCNVHYARRLRTGNLESAHRTKCGIEGCAAKHKAKGLCANHYRKLRLYGDPLLSKQRDSCSICTEKHYARGFCYDHWNAWRGIQRECDTPTTRLPMEPLRPHLVQLVKRKGWRFTEGLLGIQKGHLHGLITRNKTIQLDTADRICLKLGLPFDAMFNREVA